MRASGPLAALFLVPSVISALPVPISSPRSFIKDNASPQHPLQKADDLTSHVKIETPIPAVPSIEVETPEVPLLHVEVKSAECHPIIITLDGSSLHSDGVFTAADGSPIGASLTFTCQEPPNDSERASWGPPLIIANALLFVGLVLCSIMQYSRNFEIPAGLPDLERFFSRPARREHQVATEFDTQKYNFDYPIREKVLLPAPASMEEELAGFRDIVELVDDLITAEEGLRSFQ
ncbi:hypothetical protein ESCO_005195 [Escovopsis weberi]|uniref:Autophagy-related protein 27 n=1 Tax=Escovopsis weberi TaxID=150374 RepID=A0A0M8N1U9_ESCWE|nr:hypothetical protein ESCO_005195 [Escovopsis weberi]